MHARLVEPDPEWRDEWLAAAKELNADTDAPRYDVDGAAADFVALVRWLKDGSLQEGLVPQSTFWLVEGPAWIGRVSIRHWLNERLLNVGGHIGYEIRPCYRRQGFGREALRLALPLAKKLNIDPALVTCDDTNEASRRIIEANGGVFEDARPYEDGVKLRYWVPTG